MKIKSKKFKIQLLILKILHKEKQFYKLKMIFITL
jgi:hypothetical protein